MALTHLIFGLLMFAAFAITGKFMRVDFPDKDAIPPELRILMRSRHIYILLTALIHLALGLYFRPSKTKLRRAIQYLGSISLLVAGIVFVVAFHRESYLWQNFSEISRAAIYLTLFGVGLHIFGGFDINQYRKQTAVRSSEKVDL